MRYTNRVLLLSLALGLTFSTGAYALDLSPNPASWFAASPQQKAEKAAKKAEEAQKKARIAQLEADYAKKQATLALQEATQKKLAEQQRKLLDSALKKSTETESAASSQNEQDSQASEKETSDDSPVSAEQMQQAKKAAAVAGQVAKSAINLMNPLYTMNPMNWNPKTFLTGTSPKKEASKTASSEKKPAETATSATDEPQALLSTEEGSPTRSNVLSKLAIPDNDYLSLAKRYRAVTLETQRGNVTIELYPDEAPVTVANFVKLVSNGFYNQPGMKFHRVVPGFVIQTGDPTGTGAGGSKDRIPLEVKNRLSHDTKGVVAMARGASADSATSQFYITLAPQKSLDAKYAIFGRVISGLDVLDRIERGDIFYGAKLVDFKTAAKDPDPGKKNSLLKWLNN